MKSLDYYFKEFSNGKISRREFLAKASALGAMAALSPSFLASPAIAATPKKGGRFRMGLHGGATTDSMDPATISDTFAQNLNYQIRNCLVEIDHKGNPIPELAESWEASSDAATWRFKIRKGVEFHNGKTLDAEDVIDTLNHHRGEDSKSAAKGIVEAIKNIKADGKNTVVFTLDGGNADFPFVLSDYHLTIFPAGTKGPEFEKGVGTGGYTLIDWEPGVRSLTKRNPNYWKQGRAHFDEVQTLGIADVTARTNALKTDQIDHMSRCELKTIQLFEKMSNVKVTKVTGTFHFSLPMMVDKPPFDNNDVRLALKYAIDREHLLQTLLRGYGSVGNDHPIAPNQRYHASELPQRQYDPDKAKFHLKKAGIQNNTFTLHTSSEPGFIDAAVLYKEHADKAGINIELVTEPTDGYWSNVWLKKPWVSCYWSGRPTADMMFSTAYAADAKWNDTNWKHPRFNELLIGARAELDETKRRDMYFEMQRICRDEAGTIVHLFKDIVEAVSSKIGFANLAGDRETDGNKNTERWWFES